MAIQNSLFQMIKLINFDEAKAMCAEIMDPSMAHLDHMSDAMVLRTKPFQEGENDVAIKSVAEPELNQIGGTRPPRPEMDIGAFLGAYRLNQDELRYKSTYSRDSTHQGIMEKKNWFKIFPDEKDIQVTSQQTSNGRDGDMRPFIQSPRPNQEEPSCKTTCFGNLTHQRRLSNWNKVNTNFGLKDIRFLNRRILSLPYLEPHGFMRLQTYLWRPGDNDILLEEFHNILGCSHTHWIRRIRVCSFLHQDFPYSDVSVLKVFTLQQLFPFLFMHDLKALETFQRVPRNHLYLPKLSRYKALSRFPHLAQIEH